MGCQAALHWEERKNGRNKKSAHVHSNEETVKGGQREEGLLWPTRVSDTLTKGVNEWPGKGGMGVTCVCVLGVEGLIHITMGK